MPLTTYEEKYLKDHFSLEPIPENYGTALRRACAFPPVKIDEWIARINFVAALINEILDTNPDELSKINKEGKTALHYAIHSLLTYAKQNNNPNEIFYRLQLIAKIANSMPNASLNLKGFLEQYFSEPYKEDINLLYSGAIMLGVDRIPTVDLCIKAIEFILDTITTAHTLIELSKQTEISLGLDEHVTLINPLVILSAHNDSGPNKLFTEYLANFTADDFGILCLELQASRNVAGYLAEKPNASFFGMPMQESPLSILKTELFRDLIRQAQKAELQVKFIDGTPTSKPFETSIHNYIFSTFNIMLFLNPIRDLAMVYQARVASIKNNCGAIMIVGINHFDGLNTHFANMGINAKFVLVTEDMQKLISDPNVSAADKIRLENVLNSVPVINFAAHARKQDILQALSLPIYMHPKFGA